MGAMTLDQVLASLGSVYDPQANQVQQQRALIPQQLQADEQALQGQQTRAFDDILGGARRRGTGVAFGGIPLGEQAQYTATTYLPEQARLRNTYASKDLSLVDALSQINERRANTAQGIYQFGVQQDFAERQFEEQKAEAARQAAASARAAAAAGGGFDPTFGGLLGGDTEQAPGAPDKYGQIDRGKAKTAIVSLLNSKNVANISATLKAIQDSAKRGNLYDQYKLELIGGLTSGSKTAGYDPTYAKLIQQAQSYKAPAAQKTSTAYPTANPNAAKSTNALLGIKR